MALTVQNTLTNRKEPFKPLTPGKIGMYACGVTVYDICHIGHGMQAIIYDVIRNFFEFEGYEVTYVRNYTDVDDKIIDRAAKLGIPSLEHSENMIKASEEDLALLGVAPATVQPKVSEHIPEIIDLIERLIERGHAYAVDGDVYFEVRTFDEYGALSNRDPDEMRSGARVEVNTAKRDGIDFALWKKAKPGEVSWTSPWGEGRPGWHIECSAMSTKYLGENFDIHGGGKDLIFPHHENEIAQSRAACGCTYAQYWIHNGLVTVEGRKMSKSLNNYLSIRDAVKKYYPETIRFTILSYHYGSNIDFSEKSFYNAYSRLLYFYNTLLQVEALVERFPDYPKQIPPNVTLPDPKAAFRKAMEDDFNTAAAIREIGAVVKFLNDLISGKKVKQKIHALVETVAALKPCMAVLGLCKDDPATAIANMQEYLIQQKGIDRARVEELIGERNQARDAKDWSLADQIRDDLQVEGILVMDTADGTQWQVQP